MARGDHIRVARWGYSHHGIDCGDGRVVHFAGEPGMKLGALVTCTSLEHFARGGEVEIASSPNAGQADQIVRRALSRVGEGGYSLLWNNCEHFARWCQTGQAFSYQVRRGQLLAGAVGVAVRLAVRRTAIAAGASALGPVGAALTLLPLAVEAWSWWSAAGQESATGTAP